MSSCVLCPPHGPTADVHVVELTEAGEVLFQRLRAAAVASAPTEDDVALRA